MYIALVRSDLIDFAPNVCLKGVLEFMMESYICLLQSLL